MDSITTVILAPIVRHGLTTAGGVLVTMGLIDPAMQGHFVTIASGIILGLAGMAWSLKKSVKAAKK